jgi:DNA-binding SARP family transcriptional activator
MTGQSASTNEGMTLRLLSGFELRHDGVLVPLPARSQRLVALLALADRPVTRATVAAQLWPDVVNARANASLRATLWSFSRDGPALLAVRNTTLSLNPSIRIDLDCARAYASAVIDGSATGVDRVAEDALSDDVLPAWSDEWLVIERERFRQLRLHALDALCVAHARAGRYAQAITAGLTSVSSEPTRESAHRALITAHLLEGNRMEAIRQYHRYLEMARVEMGIGPSEHLQRLFQMALTDADDDQVTLR